MGAVWRGHDETLGRVVALKRVGALPGGSTPDVLRAEREARLAAQLNHPHVVAVFDLVDEGDEHWLVMENVEGTDLAELAQANGALTPDEAAPLLGAGRGRPRRGPRRRHRAPGRQAVEPAGHGGRQVKITDFGIARAEAEAALTQTGLVTGSPAYLAPEVASGQLATPASDVWSLGATLYHALSGSRRTRSARTCSARSTGSSTRSRRGRRRGLAGAAGRGDDDPGAGASAGRWRRCGTSCARAAGSPGPWQ